LLHVELFGEITIEKCVLDVELMEMPSFCSSKGKDGADRVELDDRCKNFVIIDTLDL
jgi:hypothetical protein